QLCHEAPRPKRPCPRAVLDATHPRSSPQPGEWHHRERHPEAHEHPGPTPPPALWTHAAATAGPASRTLTSHSRRATSMSFAAPLVRLSASSWKYLPLTPYTSGDVASYTSVCAPRSGVRAKTWPSLMNFPRKPGLFCPNPLRTKPGCIALALTRVPSSRRASSRVKRMFISFERPEGTKGPEIAGGWVRALRGDAAPRV